MAPSERQAGCEEARALVRPSWHGRPPSSALTLTSLRFLSTSMMFSGLMSQCTMPARTRASSEVNTWTATRLTRREPQPCLGGIVLQK